MFIQFPSTVPSLETMYKITTKTLTLIQSRYRTVLSLQVSPLFLPPQCAPPSNHLQPPATVNLFFICIILSRIFYKWNNTVYDLWGRFFFFSLSIIPQRVIQLISCINSSFLLLSSFSWYRYSKVCWSRHTLAITNKSATNTHVQVFV